MEKKQINLATFIIPNGPAIIGRVRKDGYRPDDGEIRKLRKLQIPVKAGEPVYQVWVFCKEDMDNDNWTSHGISSEYAEYFDGIQYMPDYMPAAWLEKFKEGDTTTLFETEKAVVTMTFEQLPWRYRRFGKFEDVCANLHTRIKEEQEWEAEQGFTYADPEEEVA